MNAHQNLLRAKLRLSGYYFMVRYFSITSVLVLLLFTASLVFLPLILPPLPPPPFMLMLIPIGILVVLVLLALVPSNITNIIVASL